MSDAEKPDGIDTNNSIPSKAELWNERKRARYEQVRQLHRQGSSIQTIARGFRMRRRTVRMMLRSETCPQRAIPTKRKSQIDHHVDYLAQRWAEGCHNSAQLHREIRAQGYRGSESSIRHFVAQWRAELPEGLRRARNGEGSLRPNAGAKKVVASARRAAWLLAPEAEKLEAEEKTFVERLVELSPEIAEAQSVAKEFNRILKQRDHWAFTNWMVRATQSRIPEIKKFALGLERDRSAVVAALEYEWSNAPTEGHINRLKTLKRAMYGRENFDLLRIRTLANAKMSVGLRQ